MHTEIILNLSEKFYKKYMHSSIFNLVMKLINFFILNNGFLLISYITYYISHNEDFANDFYMQIVPRNKENPIKSM